MKLNSIIPLSFFLISIGYCLKANATTPPPQKNVVVLDSRGDNQNNATKALESLRSIEASDMVYTVYENFRAYCRGKINALPDGCPFEKARNDITGIMLRAKQPYTRMPNVTSPGLRIIAPKKYHIAYVGCYRREVLRSDKAFRDCSLFFSIFESDSGLAPILAVKGTSNQEDWGNDLFGAGSRIFGEVTRIFSSMRIAVIGGQEGKVPERLKILSKLLASFFLDITKETNKIIFTGHSLGGALTQELAREIYFSTRRQDGVPQSGPIVRVITWNALSYTSFLGKLKAGFRKITDPLFKAGWKSDDEIRLEDFKNQFRKSAYLSAVNFHTADDILTQVVNNGIIGRIQRLGLGSTQVQAGDDVLLASDRFIKYGFFALASRITGHKSQTLLHDALYTFGGLKNKSSVDGLPIKKQFELMETRLEKAFSRRRAADYQKMIDESFEVINEERKILIRFSSQYGRLRSNVDYNSLLNTDLYN